MGGVSAWQSGRFADDAQTDVAALVEEDISRTATGVYDVVSTQGASTAAKVDSDLAAAHYVLGQAGGFSIDRNPRSPQVAWEAKNQLSGEVTPLSLPRVLIGDEWLGKNGDVAVPTPVVDTIKAMVGATVTIFQKTPAGDFLRVATNVQAASGARAIGTYIPVTNPDGAANPVVETVMRGETYRGNAFVVDSWLVSAYAPLTDASGEVVGVLYVGVKQQNLPALRESLEATDVGDTGHIEVYGGTGAMAGTVVISPEGARDGENMLEATDADGATYVQQMVEKATALQPGEQATVRYVDPEAGPTTVRLTYYAPWDWVIATVARDRDFSGPVDSLADGRSSMLVALVVAALVIAVLGGLVSYWVGRRLTAPLLRLRDRMAEIADGEGDLTQRMDDSRPDEVGQLSGAFNRFVDKVAGTVRDIGRCAREVATSAAGVAAVADGLAERSSRSRTQAQGAHGAAAEISTACPPPPPVPQEMGVSITEIARSAAEAAEVGRQAADLAQKTESTIAALGASSRRDRRRRQGHHRRRRADQPARAQRDDRGGPRRRRRQGLRRRRQRGQGARPGDGQGQRGDRPASAGASRRDTTAAVEAIAQIAEVIRAINDHQTTIASAVEEQTATTGEITRSVASAADGAGTVTDTLTSVSRDADDSAEDVDRARVAARELDGLSRELNRLLGAFTV